MNRLNLRPLSSLRIALMLSLLLTIAGCTHKDLVDRYPFMASLRVDYDWRYAPDAQPEGMCVWFYPMPGTNAPVRRFDFTGRRGGNIEIQTGRYRMITYNNDTEAILVRGHEAHDTHELFTRSGSLFEPVFGTNAPRAEGAQDERVVISPDMVWGCSTADIEITTDKVTYIEPEQSRDGEPRSAEQTDARTLTLYPREQVCIYTLTINNVKNLKYVVNISASVSSLAPSIKLTGRQHGTEPVTVPFSASVDGSSTIRGIFTTFGHHPSNRLPHKLVLYIWFNNGEKYYYTFDVTQQIDQAPNPYRVDIVIDNLELPQPITNGNGFNPSVDKWDEVNEEIIM